MNASVGEHKTARTLYTVAGSKFDVAVESTVVKSIVVHTGERFRAVK